MPNLRQFIESSAKFLIVLVFCSGIHAQEAEPRTSAVEQLRAILDQTRTLAADVEQLKIDQDGRELQESRHELVMRKPASFYWHTTEPYEELMVTNGDIIWRYEPDLDQVTIQPFSNDVERTPIVLLNGDAASIAASYTVSVARSEGQQMQYFTLLPRQPDNLYERLTLTFNGVVLEQMQFEDSLGQQTSLSFTEVRRNHEVPDSQFMFTPPDGVEIIDNTGE